MGIELNFRCNGPDCDVRAPEDTPVGGEFIRVEPPDAPRALVFHNWACLAFFAARRAAGAAMAYQPPPLAEGGGPGA